MKRVNIAFACLLVAVLMACTTTSAYKTIASIEAAVDKGMLAWGDWVKAKTAEGVDMTAQRAKVKAGYTAYRTSVNGYYDLRLSGSTNLEAQIRLVQTTALSILNLINSYLPTAQQVSTKAVQ